MLNCRQVTARASALLDGELSWGQRLQMRMHLAMCRHCSRFMAQLRLLRLALGDRARTPADPLPEAEVQKIIARLPFAAPEGRPD
jgi:anti-sigma factor RsiW